MTLDEYIKMLLAVRKEHGNLDRVMIRKFNGQGKPELADYDPSLSEITQLVIQKTQSGSKMLDTFKPYDVSPKFRTKFNRVLTKQTLYKI